MWWVHLNGDISSQHEILINMLNFSKIMGIIYAVGFV